MRRGALAEHPNAEGTAKAIRSTWDTLPRESVEFAVWVYLKLVGDDAGEVVSLAHSRNENVRQAVATIDTLVEAGRPTIVGVHLANDPVRQVRLATIKQLEKMGENPVSPEILSLLEDIRSSDDMPFTCHHCETSCEAHHEFLSILPHHDTETQCGSGRESQEFTTQGRGDEFLSIGV